MKRILSALTLSACLLVAVACRTPQSGTVIETYPRTVITENSKLLSNTLRVEEVNIQERNDLLSAQIRVVNSTQRNYSYAYRFRWLREDGTQIASSAQIWRPLRLNARESGFLNAMAPTKDAKDFILDVRFHETAVVR